jgi:DNA-binding LytR/AlgR family response regulator
MPTNVICRVHKSFMVSIAKIESIERSRIKIANQMIPISDTYKVAFFELLNL